MQSKTFLITGGTGFIGSALAHALVKTGCKLRIFDNDSRGSIARLSAIRDRFEFVQGDIRDARLVDEAVSGVDCVCHLASVNGTRFFYTDPDLVLDIGVKGMMNVLDACIRRKTPEFVLASSSEVYQTAAIIPTPEGVPLTIPDPYNPRYSYGGAKLISELMAINYGRKHFDRMMIFRPHNVYGPQMGWEHVIPQFIVRLARLSRQRSGRISFPIEGSGEETRSFVFIDDAVDGVMRLLEKGQHLTTYHIGTTEEVSIGRVAGLIAEYMGVEIDIDSGPIAAGSTLRRCPDISKISALGYRPKFTLKSALPQVVDWYISHLDMAPDEA
jgi:nucleoside-diphosphate-sugar epimerase